MKIMHANHVTNININISTKTKTTTVLIDHIGFDVSLITSSHNSLIKHHF